MAALVNDSNWKEIQRFVALAPAARAAGVGLAVNDDGLPSTQENHTLFEDFVTKIPPTTLFQALAEAAVANDKRRVELASTAIRYVLASQVGQNIIVDEGFPKVLVNGLSHFHPEVRKLTSTILIKNVIPRRAELLNDEELLSSVQRLLCDKEVSVSVIGNRVLRKFLSSCERSVRIATFQRLRDIQRNLQNDPNSDEPWTVEFRVLELASQVSSRDENVANDVFESGALDALFDALSSDDILVKLNVLQLVPLVAATESGFKRLEGKVMPDMINLAGVGDSTQEADAFLGDEALRTVAPLCGFALKSYGKEKMSGLVARFLETVEAGLQSGNRQKVLTCSEALGSFCGTGDSQALEFVLGYNNIVIEWLSLVGDMHVPLVAMTLHSLARALRGGSCISDEEPSETFGDGLVGSTPRRASINLEAHDQVPRKQTSLQAKELVVAYGLAVSLDPISSLVKHVQSPFEEVQVGAFAALRMIASQDAEWGLKALFTHAEFYKKVSDRALPLSKQAMEWRFSVFDAVLRNPNQGCVAGLGVLENVQRFLQRGPYVGPSAIPETKVGESAS